MEYTLTRVSATVESRGAAATVDIAYSVGTEVVRDRSGAILAKSPAIENNLLALALLKAGSAWSITNSTRTRPGAP